MKKLLLLPLLFLLVHLSNAQQRPLAIKPEMKSLKAHAQVNDGTEFLPQSHNGASYHAKSTNQDFHDIIIGNTTYDLQSNSSLGNRFIRNANGEMNATWTTAQTSGYADRGSAYTNNYTGAWEGIPANARIESKRTGWPGIARTASDREYVICHNTADSKLQLSYRTPSGTGTWTEDLTLLPSPIADGNYWPRIASGGADGNSLHAISITSPTGSGGVLLNNQNGALCYSRSTDGGATWDKVNIVLPEIDGTQYGGFSADDYNLDTKGDVIAFVAGGNWNDIVLMKSTDNGDTWTKTIVFSNPIPQPHRAWQMNSDVNGDNVADTVYTNSGSLAVLIDNNNNCHVYFDLVRALDISATADSSSYFPYAGYQLYHWKEGMAAYTQLDPTDVTGVVARPVDTNGNDTLDFNTVPSGDWAFGLYNGVGLVSHPSAAIDDNGVLYLAYSAFLEGSDVGDGRSYRHTYLISSVDNGDNWSLPFDIFTDTYSECVFGNIARTANDSIRVVYQRDGAPGHNLGTPTPEPGNDVASDIVYVAVPVENGAIGINDPKVKISGFNIYPNPADQSTQISFTSDISGSITLNIYNINGQLVNAYTKNVQPGITYWNINVENLHSGIYLINAVSGNNLTSKKLIIR